MNQITNKRKRIKLPEDYNKKYDKLFAKALLMGYKNISQAMTNPEFVEFSRSIKNKKYKFKPNND